MNFIWAHPKTESLAARGKASVKNIVKSAGYTINETDFKNQ